MCNAVRPKPSRRPTRPRLGASTPRLPCVPAIGRIRGLRQALPGTGMGLSTNKVFTLCTPLKIFSTMHNVQHISLTTASGVVLAGRPKTGTIVPVLSRNYTSCFFQKGGLGGRSPPGLAASAPQQPTARSTPMGRAAGAKLPTRSEFPLSSKGGCRGHSPGAGFGAAAPACY